MTKKEAINKKIWQEIANDFRKWKPPYRPSKRRMGIYKKLILSAIINSGKKALLLGATPEVRNLLYRLGCEVTLLDINPNVIRAMEEFMKFKNRAKEKIVIGNWLKASELLRKKFDIVIGDSVTNNLISKQLPKFFAELRKLIKPLGSVILTNGGRYPKPRKFTAEDMVRRVKKNKNYYRNKKKLMYDTWLVWAFDSKIYNPRTGDIFCDTQEKIFEDKFKKGKITREELNLLKIKLGHLECSAMGKEIEKLMKKHFKINRIFRESKSHRVFDFYRIYELRPKSFMKKKGPVLKWDYFWTFWKQMTPPWRPSGEEIKFWEEKVKEVAKRQNPKALVLGATPEIRDMLSKYLIKVVLLDISFEMKKAMDKLMKNKEAKNREKLIIDSWLGMRKIFSKDYFDIVLGDSPHHNIAFKYYDNFFKQIKKILKKDGYFCLGMISGAAVGLNKSKTPEEIVEIYKKKPKLFRNFKDRVYLLYQLRKTTKAYNKKLVSLELHTIENALRKTAGEKGITNKKSLEWLRWLPHSLFEKYTEICPDKKKDYDKLLKKHFKIIKTLKFSGHPVMKFKWTYILKPKK